ncbi:translation initiation factor eIF 4e-like domain-containing protein [Butyriboletus roseoflavus]|nr:translation initiation factor eIF 4e-like domain-containing protein [Butyriboletus roseoflavus]
MSSPPSQSLHASMHAPKPERPVAAARPPSLNQLAARINLNSTSTTASATSSPARPRLVASILRTGSQTSLSTTSTNDSIAVNAPSTRSTSPALTASVIATPPKSTTPSIPEDALMETEPLAEESLNELNQETGTVTKPPEKKVKGYKNIPSLDAITARLAKARSLSIDGSARPPEAEMVEDPKTPGAVMKVPEHPLQFTWCVNMLSSGTTVPYPYLCHIHRTIYHDTKSKAPFVPAKGAGEESVPFIVVPESEDYEAGLTVIGEFDTVESFCRYFNWLKPPSKLERNSNYHIFKSGIKPMWEDAANAQGGKWVLTMKNNPALLDRCWAWLAMALVGEELEDGDEICGAVVSLRSKVDRIQLWTRSKDDVERLNGIGKKLVKLLDVSEADSIGLEFQVRPLALQQVQPLIDAIFWCFQYNTEDRPLPNKFLSIQAMPSTSYRSTFGASATHSHKGSFGNVTSPTSEAGTPASTASGGAFGSFGIGNIGGTGWRTNKRT